MKIICDLGRTDEEKFVNIQKIKNTKQKYLRFIKIFYIIGFILLCFGVFSGAMIMDDMGVVGTIILLAIMIYLTYLYVGHFMGAGIAWGLYLYDSGNINMPELSNEKENDERMIRAYLIGGHENAAAVAFGTCTADFIIIFLFFIIGYWLGILNALLHFKECKDVEKRIKEKYNN